MILVDTNGNKYKCYKVEKPKMNTKRNVWDFVPKIINGKSVKFYHRYTGSLWFCLDDQWYKTKYEEFSLIFDEYEQELYYV